MLETGHDAEQTRREDERKRQVEREQKEYEPEQTRREKQRKGRVYDFAEDVVAYFVGDNENNEQTAEEVLA